MDKRTKAKIDACNSSVNPFKLRYRKNKDFYTLFYEINRQNGERKRASLNLQIKGSSGSYQKNIKIIKSANNQVDALNRKLAISNNLDFLNENEKKEQIQKANFIKIFEAYAREKYSNKSTLKTFHNSLQHLKLFLNNKPVQLNEINRQFCFRFKNYFEKLELKNSSKNSYLQKFIEVVSYLVENKFIKENPIPKKFTFKENVPDRQYLTPKELNKLASTPFPEYSFFVCNAFLFGCFSGFRWADLKKLKFADISNNEVKILQGKTKEYVEFKLPTPAIEILNKLRVFSNESVFVDLGSNHRGNIKIKEWVKNAEIKKTITWHVARHTFACLLLLKGVDIYHVSKLLGHTDIKSTMKYLHVLKEHKTKATEALSDILF